MKHALVAFLLFTVFVGLVAAYELPPWTLVAVFFALVVGVLQKLFPRAPKWAAPPERINAKWMRWRCVDGIVHAEKTSRGWEVWSTVGRVPTICESPKRAIYEVDERVQSLGGLKPQEVK